MEPIAPHKMFVVVVVFLSEKIPIFFLFLHENTCCGVSEDPAKAPLMSTYITKTRLFNYIENFISKN